MMNSPSRSHSHSCWPASPRPRPNHPKHLEQRGLAHHPLGGDRSCSLTRSPRRPGSFPAADCSRSRLRVGPGGIRPGAPRPRHPIHRQRLTGDRRAIADIRTGTIGALYCRFKWLRGPCATGSAWITASCSPVFTRVRGAGLAARDVPGGQPPRPAAHAGLHRAAVLPTCLAPARARLSLRLHLPAPPGRPAGTEAGRHAVVRSWVRADRAALGPVLYNVVLAWLERDWPFHSIQCAPRGMTRSPSVRAVYTACDAPELPFWTVGIAQAADLTRAPNGYARVRQDA